MRSSFVLPLVSFLSLVGCAMKGDVDAKLNGIDARIDGVADQIGELSNPEGVVTTTFSADNGALGCNAGELVDGSMTVILDTSEGRVQTVRGWERVLLGGVTVNADNLCIDGDGKPLTEDRISAAIGTSLGKVGLGGGVTAECLMGMNGTPCTIKPVPVPTPPVAAPVAATPVAPAATTTPSSPTAPPAATPDDDEPGTSPV